MQNYIIWDFFAPDIDILMLQFSTLKPESGFSRSHWSILRIKTALIMEYSASAVTWLERIGFFLKNAK